MFDVIADATSQPFTGMRYWTPEQWAVWGASFLVPTLIALAAFWKSTRADTNSTNANVNASAARTSADHAGNIAAEARGMAQTSVPTPTIPLTPIAPTPEAIAKGLADCAPENKPPENP